MRYIYPENLNAVATMWLWSLKDFAITAVGVLIGVVTWAQFGAPIVIASAAVFAFLTIRTGDITILDFIGNCIRFFMTSQQIYFWRFGNE